MRPILLIAASVISLGCSSAMAAITVTHGPAGRTTPQASKDPAAYCTAALNKHRIKTAEEEKGAPIQYTDEEKAKIQACVQGRDKSKEKTLREYWLKNRGKPVPPAVKNEE